MNKSNWLRNQLTLRIVQTESFASLCCGTKGTSQEFLCSSPLSCNDEGGRGVPKKVCVKHKLDKFVVMSSVFDKVIVSEPIVMSHKN